MMKKILFTLLTFMATVAMYADQVSKQQALLKAQQFMPGKQFVETKSLTRSAGSSDDEAFYIFNAEGGQGFVIVSGDDRTTDILGYSTTGNLDTGQLPENLKWWLDGYARQMEAIGSSVKPVTTAKTRGADSWNAVKPMIKTKWNQYYPYNMMCPDSNGKVLGEEGFDTEHMMTEVYDQVNYHCVTGCVATAMAQVIYYWQCSSDCPVIPAYQTYTRGWKMKELPTTTFDWDHMKLDYDGSETGASAEAIATLLRYCGQAVEMDYNLGGSSAGVTPYELSKYFGFDINAKQVIRSMYSTSDWESMIYKEMAEERPVLYGGSSISGGHRFIIDGYDGKGLFHMNWGWGGTSDGYFVLSLANPKDLGAGGGTSEDGYSYDQNAIIGLKPGNGEDEAPQFYAEFCGSLEKNKYTRESASENFTNVKLPGNVLFQYNDPYKIGKCTFHAAWGLYQNGQLLEVLGETDPINLYNGYFEDNQTPFSFGSGLADGQYQFRQMCKIQGSSEWQPCMTYMTVFVEAIISGNNLTLRKSSEKEYSTNIEVNSVSFSSSSIEAYKPVELIVNLTNRGDAYQEPLFLSYGSEKSLVCGSVEPGRTGDVVFHFVPTAAGEMTLVISTDYEGTNVLRTETITVGAAKPQSISGTMVIDNYDKTHRVLTGTTLKVTAQVTNKGENIYDNVIQFVLCRNTEDPSSDFIGGPVVTEKSVMAYIQPGETKEVVFVIEDLNPDDMYFFQVYYYSAGSDKRFLSSGPFTLTTEEPTPVPGDVDGDGDVDKADVETIMGYIMAGEYVKEADLNNDDKVDVADIVACIKLL